MEPLKCGNNANRKRQRAQKDLRFSDFRYNKNTEAEYYWASTKSLLFKKMYSFYHENNHLFRTYHRLIFKFCRFCDTSFKQFCFLNVDFLARVVFIYSVFSVHFLMNFMN